MLILTRPQADSLRFLGQVETALGWTPPSLIAPMLRIDPVLATVPGHIAALVFTSENGVAQAHRVGVPPGLTAYCVGDRTAEQATRAGFRAISAGADAATLINLILSAGPNGVVAHLHGRETRGDVAATLTRAGVKCLSILCYDQTALAAQPDLIAALRGENRIVLPLFSPRSAALLGQACPSPIAPILVIALSRAVADAAAGLATSGMILASAPTGPAMVRATCDGITGPSRLETGGTDD